MRFGAFVPCINRRNKFLDTFVNAIRYYSFFRYKRILILFVIMFNIDKSKHIFPAVYV